MPVTVKEILALRDQVKASDSELTPAEILKGVRTLVHDRLQQETPPPFPLPDPSAGKSDAEYQAAYAKALRIRDAAPREAELRRLHHEHVRHHAERVVKARQSVPIETVMEFEARRQELRPQGVNDPHHYAQREHGIKLWEQTDKLVADAGLMPAKAVS